MIALLIIDHGSKRKEANDMLSSVASLLQKKRPDLIIEMAHMELASPTIEEGFTRCIQKGATHIIVHPYMLSPGRHATQDIPEMIQSIAKNHPKTTYKITPPLGLHEKLTDIILERAELT